MARARDDAGHEVINLASDSEDEALSEDNSAHFDAHDRDQDDMAHFPVDLDEYDLFGALNAHHSPTYETPNGIIDLTHIPDIDVPPSDLALDNFEAPVNNDLCEDHHLVTEAVALQIVLDVLPDVSVDHVLNIIREKTTDLTRTNAQCHDIVTQLLDGEVYPKEEDETSKKKRKRDDEDDWKEYEKSERDPGVLTYELDAAELLKDEFRSIPVRHITNVLKDQKTLFKSYIVLEEQARNYDRLTSNRIAKIGKARIQKDTENRLIERGSQIPKELHAAKRKVESEMTKRRKADEEEQAEADNRSHAEANKQMGECACCFDDVPLNRMIICSGDTSHSYCLECPKRQIETQMGLSKCRPKCFGVDDCNGTFTRRDLQKVLGNKTFERLEHLQQQEDLAAAGLDFLSECPFCDFKMECPPVEVDKEFRCQNKKCGKTSCRLCERETHIPLTCKEADKDGQITLRHIVEEAMSAALIRQCNRCKHPFVKDHGCNKMTCSHCKNVQCYVCSKNVTTYEHFGEVGQGRCPLHENVEDRHEQEVKKAADEAMAKVRADNPHLDDAALMIQVSDRVKQAEDARRGRAQVHANAFRYHMVGNQLQNGVGPVAPLVGAIRALPRHPPVAQYVPAHPYALAPFPVFVPQQHVQPQQQQFVQPHQIFQPAPQYYNPMGPALQQPHQPAGGYGFDFFPLNGLNHIFGGNGMAQPQAPQQAPPAPPPAPLPRQHHYLQAHLPQPMGLPANANHLGQRLNQLQQVQQRQAEAHLQRRLRLMNLQRENLVQQRDLLEEDMDEQNDRAALRRLEHLAQARRQTQAARAARAARQNNHGH